MSVDYNCSNIPKKPVMVKIGIKYFSNLAISFWSSFR